MRRDREPTEDGEGKKTTATSATTTGKAAPPSTSAINSRKTAALKEQGISPYSGTIAERSQRVRSFIQSLQFTVPLKQLRNNAERTKCPKCDKQRLFYCYDCVVPCNDKTKPPAPPVLPAHVHIVLHPGEHRSKSTSLPAATVAPDQITVHTFPKVPDLDPKETVLLYPSATAVDISELPPSELDAIKNVVFIDSTWQQSKQIEREAKIQSYRHVKIPAQETLFWRFQNFDPTYLATVEAIYYTLKEIIKARNAVKKQQASGDDASKQKASSDDLYGGEVDDLLLYFVYQYILIQTSYTKKDEGPAKTGGTASAAAKEESGAAAAAAAAAADSAGANSATEQQKQYTGRHFAEYILEGASFEDFFK